MSALKQSLSTVQKQLQKLSPAQVQFLKLLQLPVLSLEQKIKDELESNPMLEEGEDEDMDQSQQQEMNDIENGPDEKEVAPGGDGEGERSDYDGEYMDREIRNHQDDEYSWQEFIENNEESYSRNWYDREDEEFEIQPPSEPTLRDKLIEQLQMLNLPDNLFSLGEEIIDSVEDDGYLRREIEEIVAIVNYEHGFDLSFDDGERVLRLVQRFDPPGIAARDLKECLIIQLEQIIDPSLDQIIALRIVREAYEDFTRKHFVSIKKSLRISDVMLRRAYDVIRKLNPKPGEGRGTTGQNYVIPDFFLYRDRDDFIISLNERGVPPLRVNKTYQQIEIDKRSDTLTRRFLKQKHEEAKWFIQSILQRRQTMMSVMQAIVIRQRDFMTKGPGNLKPLIYRDIAEMIQMDISTISRVVNGKYVQTEWGVFELKHFFSEGISTTFGEEVANKEVKSIIRTIISDEDPSQPLSDESIMQILNTRGFNIARRTVAKYRESLGIPVARLRTQIA
jgi:RNA polymerase sigma-54 factor